MAESHHVSVLDHFADLDDPRVERTRRHKLVDIIAIAICAIICGADSWVHVELFGRSKLEWFQTFLELPGGFPPMTPSAMFLPVWTQSSSRVASWPGPKPSLSCCPRRWWPLTGRRPGVLTTARVAREPCIWSAMAQFPPWATQNTLTLGQVRTAEKSNEITAIPQLLDLLDLQGCIVTIDAMGCQREIAQQIVDGGADYVLAVKENQGQLHEGIRDLFEGAEALGFDGVPYDYSQTVNKGHGRVERRECWAITETDCLDYINPHGQWPQLNAAIKVVGHRETAAGAISQPRYYISSRAAPAGQLLAAVRSHWSIENSLHWTLDVTFREDQCRVRKAHGPQNLATLRQISHNLLKNENTLKVGIQGKRLNAGWREDYLLKVLLG